MKAPTIFKPFDIVAMLIPSVVSTVGAVLCWFYVNPLEGRLIAALTAAAFIGISILQLVQRYRFIKSHNVVLPYNVYVKTNGYKGSVIDMELELSTMLTVYSREFRNARDVFSAEPVWVEFVPDVMAIVYHGRVAGYVAGDSARVSYFRKLADGTTEAWPDAPVSRTAFAHELAHVLIGRVTGGWDNDTHHELMAKVEMSRA